MVKGNHGRLLFVFSFPSDSSRGDRDFLEMNRASLTAQTEKDARLLKITSANKHARWKQSGNRDLDLFRKYTRSRGFVNHFVRHIGSPNCFQRLCTCRRRLVFPPSIG